jgi:CRP/FNR family transcriptional regulator
LIILYSIIVLWLHLSSIRGAGKKIKGLYLYRVTLFLFTTLNQAIDTYLNSVKSLCPRLSGEEIDYFKTGLRITELKPRHFFIHANALQQEIGFVYSGLLRAFYVDENGNEITVNFIPENRYATHYSAFISRTPSKYYFQCLEPTVLVTLSFEHIQGGYEKFVNIERYGRLVAESVLKSQQKRIESFLFDRAEQRYLDFIQENPNLFNRISLSHLSSFLGIERQTLTRIRQKLARS